ncbi:hypothetical protein ACEZDB_12175 [Streptacidiphilus sp. N1-3]|uniref:Uncharacterized protein n=1 Tax=Streptacidiphilus alkalitolerans TaxID=3342712 RepID=A0ABV6WZI2_9ACTN
MKNRRKHAALAAAVTLSALAGTTAAAPARTHATGPHAVGTVRTTQYGVPRTLKRGGTITLSIWYRQNSRYTMEVYGYDLGLWNFAAPGFGQLKGITTTFLDPVTGKWEKPRYADPNGSIVFEVPLNRPGFMLKPNALGHVLMRITFGKTAHLGTWHQDAYPASYSLVNSKNADDPDYLDIPSKNFTFTLVK